MMTFREELLHKKRQRVLEENPEECKHMKKWLTDVFLDLDQESYRSKHTDAELKVIEALGFNYDVLDAVLDYEDVEPGKPYVRVNRGVLRVTSKHTQKVKYDLVTDTYTIRDSKGNVIRVDAKVVEDAVDKKRR